MNTKQNLHTHSIYCDGKDTPEQMIETAIEKGFGSIGFSSHSYTECSSIFTMKEQTAPQYREHIERLKKEYEGKIDIFLGVEFDIISDRDDYPYDYRIGAVHNLPADKGIASFDRGVNDVIDIINNMYDGDGMKFAKDYYEKLSTLPEYGSFDIVAHFDIITKNIEKADLFDFRSKEYMRYATDAMDALCGKIPFFELNTGAISRGYRKTPYPDMPLLKQLRLRGFKPIISSDCHDRNFLDCQFDLARDLLIESGFKERYILTKDGWKAVQI